MPISTIALPTNEYSASFIAPYSLPGRTPDRDEEIFRNDGQFVKDKQQEQIETKEHAIDAANQREIEGEELLRAVLDVPGK